MALHLQVVTLSHQDLVQLAARWLKAQCGVVLTEIGGGRSVYGEMPDAIGWSGSCSTVVECKRSRHDFFQDQKKPFRVNPKHGMGSYRFYLAPKGLLSPADVIPSGWGLLETSGKRVVLRLQSQRFLHRSMKAELRLMYTALQRVQFRIACPLAEVVSWETYGKIVPILPLEEVTASHGV